MNLTLSDTLKTGFLATRPIYFFFKNLHSYLYIHRTGCSCVAIKTPTACTFYLYICRTGGSCVAIKTYKT